MPEKPICRAEGCSRSAVTRGLCLPCYNHYYRTGELKSKAADPKDEQQLPEAPLDYSRMSKKNRDHLLHQCVLQYDRTYKLYSLAVGESRIDWRRKLKKIIREAEQLGQDEKYLKERMTTDVKQENEKAQRALDDIRDAFAGAREKAGGI